MKGKILYIQSEMEYSTGYLSFVQASTSTSDIVTLYIDNELEESANIREKEEEEEDLGKKLKFYK